MAEGITRRGFLVRSGRILALAGIGALAAKLLGASAHRSNETCVNDGLCRGCPTFDGCGLPAARSAKERAPRAPQAS